MSGEIGWREGEGEGEGAGEGEVAVGYLWISLIYL